MDRPQRSVLAPSRSKKEFFERLGLSEDNAWHRHLYNQMKAYIPWFKMRRADSLTIGGGYRRPTPNNSDAKGY